MKLGTRQVSEYDTTKPHIGGDECQCPRCERNEAIFILFTFTVLGLCALSIPLFMAWKIYCAIVA